MSVQAMTWAFEQQVDPPAKLVLLALANRTNHETGVCYPGQELLGKECSMSDRTIRRHLRRLEAEGLLKRRARMAPEGRGRTSDEYRLACYDQPDKSRHGTFASTTNRTNQDDQPDTVVRGTVSEPKGLSTPTAEEPGSPAGSHSYARALVDKLSQKGIDIDEGADRDAAYRALLVKGMAAFPDEKALPNRVIGEYLTACDISLDRKGWAIIGRNLKAKAPLTVFDAVAEAVRWGAGTGDYEADPASFAKYVAGILGGKR